NPSVSEAHACTYANQNVAEQSDSGLSNLDSGAAARDVSERFPPLGNNSAAYCFMPQCDPCLALLQTQQIPLAPTHTSCANSVRSQLDNSSHTNSSQNLSKPVAAQNQMFVCPSSSGAPDAHRKISVVSNQSTMSTDSDYVSDTNNLYFDPRSRKLSDVPSSYELASGEIFHYSKPASFNLNLNLAAANSFKSTMKDQCCQTPEFPLANVDPRHEVKISDIQNMRFTTPDPDGGDDLRRKISNISTISTLSSMSAESASTFDTVTHGVDVVGGHEDPLAVRVDDGGRSGDQLQNVAQVSHVPRSDYRFITV
ncbi:unnamed protein product, partial [Ilex paraguariensis]